MKVLEKKGNANAHTHKEPPYNNAIILLILIFQIDMIKYADIISLYAQIGKIMNHKIAISKAYDTAKLHGSNNC